MNHKQLILSLLLMACSLLTASANDGVYFTSGNFLVPTQETDISVDREILTITIGNDGFARVDVYYEFVNHGAPKIVTMAFEAEAPYNADMPSNLRGPHPYINHFTANMNGQSLSYDNALVALRYTDGKASTDFTPLDLTQWKGGKEVPPSVDLPYDLLYNAKLDSIVPFAYAYFFKATFRPGRNIVRHTYSYRMSYNVAQRFTIPYWLTPATRWANHQIDHFTLRITADEPTSFCMADSLFRDAPFTTNRHNDLYHLTTDQNQSMLFARVGAGDTLTWQAAHFRPTADMCIEAPIWERGTIVAIGQTSAKVVVDRQGQVSRYIANCGDNYFIDVQDYGLVKKSESHIEEYAAEKGQGYLVINDAMAHRVNVRQRPTTESAIVGQISYHANELPDVFPCLGLVVGQGRSNAWQWFKLRIGNTTGYVRQDLMVWDPIDSY